MFMKKVKSRFKKRMLKPNPKKVSEDFSAPAQMPYITSLGGVSPLDYTLMKGMEYMPDIIAGMAGEILDKIQFDEFNDGSFMDQYIDLYVGLAANDLKRQQIHHGHVIEGLKIIEDSRLLYDKRMYKMAEEALEEYKNNIEKGEK